MYTAHCVLVLLSFYAGMANSFSWEIVTTADSSNRLDFYDIDGTLTHSENITSPSGTIDNIIYDPVHDRVLYADSRHIYTFEIATKKNECLIRDTYRNITSLAYDPATELLFWTEFYRRLYSISLKSGLNNNKVNEKQLISWGHMWILDMAVDSCGGFIYYSQVLSSNYSVTFERARFDGSEREVEVVVDRDADILFDPDQQSHKLYWSEKKYDDTTGTYKFALKYADLNGRNIRTIRQLKPKLFSYWLTVSEEFIYLRTNDFEYGNGSIWKIPKKPPHDFDIESQLFIESDQHISGIAVKYSIEDITRGHQNCDTLKSLLPNNSVSTDVSQLCVHGTEVSGEPRCECAQGYSGERCDYKISECHNYCLHGDCSVSAEGQPKCRCNAGYSGDRCEVNACQAYCLNDGVCTLSEDSKPVCQCTREHEGDRCEDPFFLTNCCQTVSILRDFLNKDVTSVNGVKSTCASTPSTVF